jgi:hypothetical protein
MRAVLVRKLRQERFHSMHILTLTILLNIMALQVTIASLAHSCYELQLSQYEKQTTTAKQQRFLLQYTYDVTLTDQPVQQQKGK